MNQNLTQLFSPNNMLQAFYEECPARLNAQGEGLLSLASVNPETTPTEIIYDVDSCINLREDAGKALIQILASIFGTLTEEVMDGFALIINNPHQFTILPVIKKEIRERIPQLFLNLN